MSAQPKSREQVRARTAPEARRERLREVARRVRDDAQIDPERTLREGEVPAGGE